MAAAPGCCSWPELGAMCVGSGPTLCSRICSEQLGWLALGPGLVEDRGLQGPGWYRRAHSPVGISWAPMNSRAPKAAPGPSHDRYIQSRCHQQGELSLPRWRSGGLAFHGARGVAVLRNCPWHSAGTQNAVSLVCWICVVAQGSGPGCGILGPRWAGVHWLTNHHTQRLRTAAHSLPGWRS